MDINPRTYLSLFLTKVCLIYAMPGLGLIGYVANSYKTVIGESYSAGRLYDKIGDTAVGTVMYLGLRRKDLPEK